MNKIQVFSLAILIAAAGTAVSCSDDASGSGASADTSSGGASEDGTSADGGKSCTSSADCGTNKICKDNQCIDKPVQDTAECKEDSDCGQRQVCRNSICESAAYQGDYCNDSIICLNDTLCIDNICSVYVDVGHDCIAGYACREGFVCNRRAVCTVPSALGEACDNFERVCAQGAYCDAESNTCVKGGSVGDKCDPAENLGCETGTVCRDGICRQIAVLGQNCSESIVCFSETASCYDGECRELGHCTSDNECSADTYCCIEDGCSVRNVCLPYGEGPRPAVNEQCVYETVPGLFEADIQCEWKKPGAEDPYPSHYNILMTPLVMNTPFDSGSANEIIFTAYNGTDGGGNSGNGASLDYNGVIRIINAETCALHQTIFDNHNRVIGGSNLAMADLDGDGRAEIVASRGSAQIAGAVAGGGVVIFKWNNTSGKYETWMSSTNHSASTLNWGGPAIHDINNDGKAEIIGYGGEVFAIQESASAGGEKTSVLARLNPGQTISELSYTPTLGDFDNDGSIEIIGTENVYRWNSGTGKWETAYKKALGTGIHEAFADFGTPNPDGTFDYTKLDGIAEVAACGNGHIRISTLVPKSSEGAVQTGKAVLNLSGYSGGGPCTIGDFDGDGLPELATAFGDSYRIFDPRCVKDKDGKLPDGCAKDYILWEKVSQDASSASTGSSLFDFDGDGTMEAVYADEAFTRIYDGKTGEVLFSSYHNSCTWHEYPVIADVDNDESAEIVVGSNLNCNTTCKSSEIITKGSKTYAVDPVHRGLKCVQKSDCFAGDCIDGLCRCTDDAQCNSKADSTGQMVYEYACYTGLNAADQAGGKVCRAIHPQSEPITGVRVMRDRLDRWVSSRNLWNQHAYSITNINDDQTVPKTSDWVQNFSSKDPVLNNFRQNVQGARGKNAAPDITGKLNKGNLCVSSEGSMTLTGMVCNRGTKMVASKMPASFYKVNEDGSIGEKYCTAYTSENVPVGGCLDVSCTVNASDIRNTKIRMISNDDGKGGKTTVECNDKNNADEIVLDACGVN